MARMTLEDADKRLKERDTSSGGFVNTFYLKNDKDTNIVKFLLDDVKDIEVYSVHEVKMTSKNGVPYRVQVNCLGDGCPLCKEAQKYKDQMFPLVSRAKDNIYLPVIKLYDNDGNKNPEFAVWVRSTKFYRDSFSAVVSRYGLKDCYEIERRGAKGEKQVAYNMFPITNGKDNKGDDIPFAGIDVEKLKEDFDVTDTTICGARNSLIRSWSAEDFAEFLETGSYPKGSSSSSSEDDGEVVPRSRSSKHGF